MNAQTIDTRKARYIPVLITGQPGAAEPGERVSPVSTAPINVAPTRQAVEMSKEPVKNNYYASMQPVTVPSPVDRLWWLQDGWDGGRAERLSKTVLRHACAVWKIALELTPDDLPRVNPSPDAYVIFSWSDHYPTKELQLSVLDKKDLNCVWVQRGQIGKDRGKCDTSESIKTVVTRYQQFNDGQHSRRLQEATEEHLEEQ